MGAALIGANICVGCILCIMIYYVVLVVALSVVVGAVWLINKYLNARLAHARAMSAKMRAVRAGRSAPAAPAVAAPAADLPDWIPDLLESFGVDPAVLSEDEMPAELAALLPVARGFVSSGGLDRLGAGASSPASSPPAPEDYI